MAWLEGIAERLNISTKVLLIILGVVGVLLIAALVLGIIFWQDIHYHFQVGRLHEGDAVHIRYAFSQADSDTFSTREVLKEDFSVDPEPLPCMGQEKNCEVYFFDAPAAQPPSLIAMVANTESGYPVSLHGISFQFIEYQPYTNVNVGLERTVDVGFAFAVEDRLPTMLKGDEIVFAGAEEWLSQKNNPENVVDKYFYLNMPEEYEINPALISMQADELDYLTIQLPFSASTPPGWYAFAVSMQYETPEGNRYRTSSQVMNVLVPDSVNYFLYENNDEKVEIGEPYFFQYRPFSNEVIAREIEVSPAADFTMVMKVEALQENGLEIPSGFWKYDLQSGTAVEIHPSSSTSSFRGSGTVSNSGWQQVNLTPDYTWSLYDFASDTTLLLDNTEHYTTPSWSPDDTRISFFHVNEKNVIGIYDVEKQKMQEIALDVNGEIEDMHWYSNATLLLMVRDGGVTRFQKYHLESEMLEIIHNVAEIDTDEFVVTMQGQIVVVNADFGITIPQKKYIYSLEFGNAGVDGWYCAWLSDEFVALCSTGGNVYLVDQINETTDKILETGGLASFEKFGSNGLAVITLTDDVHLFDVHGEEVAAFHIEGISEQHWLGMHFTFLQGQ